MRFTAKILLIILSLMAGSAAFAECIDNYVADCGDFNLLNTVCPLFDGKGRPTGKSDILSLQFHDDGKRLPLTPFIYNDVAIYKGELLPGINLVVNFSSQLLSDMKRKSRYSAYTEENALKSSERECKEYVQPVP